MPCCAFAACVLGQLLLVLRAARRRLFGLPFEEPRNQAVEWRLDDAPPASPPVAAPAAWRWSPRTLGALAAAAAVEIALVLGAAYGVAEHFGLGAGGAHGAHGHAAIHVEQEVQP